MKQLSELKFGDRVAIYDSAVRRVGTVSADPNSLRAPGLYVRPDGLSTSILVLPQQCRRLKKKEKRRVWIDVNYASDAIYHGEATTTITRDKRSLAQIEFVEVRK